MDSLHTQIQRGPLRGILRNLRGIRIMAAKQRKKIEERIWGQIEETLIDALGRNLFNQVDSVFENARPSQVRKRDE